MRTRETYLKLEREDLRICKHLCKIHIIQKPNQTFHTDHLRKLRSINSPICSRQHNFRKTNTMTKH